jgi:hypothetical protein
LIEKREKRKEKRKNTEIAAKKYTVSFPILEKEKNAK